MNILILITGGTFDKIHDPVTENLIFSPDKQSAVGDVLERGRSFIPNLQVLMLKDSLDMTDTDRNTILNAIKDAEQDRIVVTHGTGTMELTAKYLDGKIRDKTVVLTGAMRPHSLGQSDASYNLGGAIVAVQTLAYGVYAVMNGRVIAAQNVRKDTQAGRFDR